MFAKRFDDEDKKWAAESTLKYHHREHENKKELTQDDFLELGSRLLSIERKDVIDGITHMAEILNQEKDDSYYITDAFVESWDTRKSYGTHPGGCYFTSAEEVDQYASEVFMNNIKSLDEKLATYNDKDKKEFLSRLRASVLLLDISEYNKKKLNSNWITCPYGSCYWMFFSNEFNNFENYFYEFEKNNKEFVEKNKNKDIEENNKEFKKKNKDAEVIAAKLMAMNKGKE